MSSEYEKKIMLRGACHLNKQYDISRIKTIFHLNSDISGDIGSATKGLDGRAPACQTRFHHVMDRPFTRFGQLLGLL